MGNVVMISEINLKKITSEYDADLALLIRRILKAYHLDIPGTAFFDDALDHLSSYYAVPGRAYYVLLEGDRLLGGVGLAECSLFSNCCELQKLYLDESARGQGFGHKLIAYIESIALRLGYQQIYLETHTNLQTAIHLYENCGYREIPKPAAVVHNTMNRFYLKGLSEQDEKTFLYSN